MCEEAKCCGSCYKEKTDIEYYIVNPAGGYGRDELVICIDCLKLPKNKDIYERLLELDCLEKRDVIL